MRQERFITIGIATLVLMAGAATATTFEYNGKIYDSVDWSTVNSTTEMASGTAAGMSVDVSAVNVWNGVIHDDDFAADATAYGMLGLDPMTFFETFKMTGGTAGTTTLTFGAPVSSVLVIFGRPNSNFNEDQWGPGRWDFDDSLTIEIIDDEGAGLTVLAGNVVDSLDTGQISGVFEVRGAPFTSLEIAHTSTAGIDITAATYALSVSGACCLGGGSPGTPAECAVLEQDDCLAQNGFFLGSGSDCGELDCIPLLVDYEFAVAEAVADGVLLTWSTTMEIDTVGFRVLRQAEGTEKSLVPISPVLPATGHGLTGSSYQFLDNSKAATRAVQYYLEDIDVWGKTTLHGPIMVERGERRQAPPRTKPR